MSDKDYEDGFIDCFEWITKVIEEKYKIEINRNDLLEELKHPKKWIREIVNR